MLTDKFDVYREEWDREWFTPQVRSLRKSFASDKEAHAYAKKMSQNDGPNVQWAVFHRNNLESGWIQGVEF